MLEEHVSCILAPIDQEQWTRWMYVFARCTFEFASIDREVSESGVQRCMGPLLYWPLYA